MALICNGCGSRYAKGLKQCPQCSRTDYRDEHEDAAPVPVPEPEPEPEVVPDPTPEPDSTPPPSSPESSGPRKPPPAPVITGDGGVELPKAGTDGE